MWGREDWLTDHRFSTPEARRTHFDAMTAELATGIATKDAAIWEAGMSAEGIPGGMVRSVDEAAALARPGALLPMTVAGLPDGASVSIPNLGFQTDPGAPGTGAPPPRLDETPR